MTRLRLAVIGVGHLGKEHARILAGLPDVELVGVVDANPEQARVVAQRCNCPAFPDHRLLIPLIDAAIIAVPTVCHFGVARDFLLRGISLLIEKPLAPTVEQADTLVELAQQHDALVQVGHIERFNPAFEELRHHALQPKFVACERLGPFTGRSTDIGIVLDLMIHDLDLLQCLVEAPVRNVQAVGVSLFGEHEDVANARLTFENGCVATLTASRASPTATRRMQIWSPEGYVSIDFGQRHMSLIQPTEHLRQQRFNPHVLDSAMRGRPKEDFFGQVMEVLHLDCAGGDQLTRELQHFVRCVQTGTRPRVSAEDGRDAVALAARILDSLRSHAWDGHADGPVGPNHLPLPIGRLFGTAADKAAA